jgi:putative transposase
MGAFYLQAGLVISRLGQILELAASQGTELYFEEPETGKRVTLNERDFWGEFSVQKIKVVDAFSSPQTLAYSTENVEKQIASLESFPLKYREDAIRKFQYVLRLRKAGITRGQKKFIESEVKRIAEEIQDPLGVPGVSTVQGWWKKLDRSNYEVYAVVSGHANRNRNPRLDDESDRFVQDHIENEFCVRNGPSRASTYRGYVTALSEANDQRKTLGLKPLVRISERSFYNRIQKMPQEELMVARLGREAARHHFRMIKGHLPSEHPLDVVEIDHTPLNVFVVDDLSLLPLGRAWLTVIKDRHTGVLLGFYISFQKTGLESIFGCIKHSLVSHHLAYELWPDIVNPWPAFGRGDRYLSDRGPDFISPRYRTAIIELGALYEYCRVRTPWLKGSVERYFLTMEQSIFEAMPGRTFSCLKDRGDYKPEKDIVVRFTTFVYLMHKWAADYHNVFVNKRKQARPLDLWLDGIGEAPPPYPRNIDSLNITLGEHYTGTLSQEGIRFAWLNYADDNLKELMGHVGKGATVNYVVSREDLGYVHVKDPRTDRFFKVPCTRPEYASGLSLFQHQYLRKEAGIRLGHSNAVDTLLETRARTREVIQEELAAKDNKNKAKLARIAGINSNSVLEGNKPSILSPFKEQPSANPINFSNEEAPAFTNVPKYTWGG